MQLVNRSYLSFSSQFYVIRLTDDPGSNEHQTDQEAQVHKGLSRRSQAVGAVLSVLLVVLTACLIILLFYKKERR